MKRGLAAIAVSAVAVVGIPALAMANSIDSQVTAGTGSPTDVQLYNPTFTLNATTKNDGTDSTVRLEAGGGNNVAQVTFQVRKPPSAVFSDIATGNATVSRNDDGAFFVEWNPADNGVFPGDTFEIRAVNTAINPVVAASSDLSGVFTLRNATASTTQAINIAAGEQKGYFQDPDVNVGAPHGAPGTAYTVGVTGTTTVTSTLPADRPVVSSLGGNGAFQNFAFGTNSGDGTFDAVLTMTTPPYVWDDPALPPAEADQLMTNAVTNTPGDDTDDYEAFTLYEQVLTSVTTTIAPAEEPDPNVATVTVLDQNGNPIAGIDVYARLADGTFIGTPGATDGRGQVVTPVPENGLYFYANADASDVFSPGAGDKRGPDVNTEAASVSVATGPSDGTQPIGTSVTETVTVTDNNGDPISNRDVRFKRTGPGGEAETVVKTTNSQGVVTYSFTCNVAGVANIDIGIRGPVPPLADPFTFATASDSVTCKNPNPPKAINAKLSGHSSQGKDILMVNAPSIAAGATVVLQKKVGNSWVTIGKAKKLDGSGNRQFGAKDKNGKHVTKYRARVSGNANVKSDTTPVKRIK